MEIRIQPNNLTLMLELSQEEAVDLACILGEVDSHWTKSQISMTYEIRDVLLEEYDLEEDE